MSRRYILEFIPKADVEKLCEKHKAEIDAGASAWDICPPEYMTKEREWRTEADALTNAKSLVKLDEFGEVHAFEQELQTFGSYRDWEITRRAVFYEGDEKFDWERY